VVADTDAEAERIALSADLHYARRAKANICRSRRPKRPPPIPIRRSIASAWRGIGRGLWSAALTASRKAARLIETTRADELMITTMVYNHAARRHSYELWRRGSG